MVTEFGLRHRYKNSAVRDRKKYWTRNEKGTKSAITHDYHDNEISFPDNRPAIDRDSVYASNRNKSTDTIKRSPLEPGPDLTSDIDERAKTRKRVKTDLR